MLLLLSLAKLLEVAWNSSVYILRIQQQRSVVVEAIDPFKWAITLMSNIYKVFCTLHMLWMCMCICPYHVATPLISQAYGSCLEFCLHPQEQTTA